MILKLKMLVNDEDNEHLDYWLKAEDIRGFYIPLDLDGNKDHGAINLTLSGETVTVLNEPHVERFLMEHFVSQT